MSSPSKFTPKTACIVYLRRLAAAGPLEAISQNTIIIITNIRITAASEAGWKHLAERFACLAFVLQEFRKVPNKKEGKESFYFDLVAKCLGPLRSEIQKAGSRGESGLMEFFGNGDKLGRVALYDNMFSGLIESFTTFVCSNTRYTEDYIRARLSDVSRDLRISLSANGGIGSLNLSNNRAANNEGKTFTNMSFARGMNVTINDNTAVDNKGDTFSHISIN